MDDNNIDNSEKTVQNGAVENSETTNKLEESMCEEMSRSMSAFAESGHHSFALCSSTWSNTVPVSKKDKSDKIQNWRAAGRVIRNLLTKGILPSNSRADSSLVHQKEPKNQTNSEDAMNEMYVEYERKKYNSQSEKDRLIQCERNVDKITGDDLSPRGTANGTVTRFLRNIGVSPSSFRAPHVEDGTTNGDGKSTPIVSDKQADIAVNPPMRSLHTKIELEKRGHSQVLNTEKNKHSNWSDLKQRIARLTNRGKESNEIASTSRKKSRKNSELRKQRCLPTNTREQDHFNSEKCKRLSGSSSEDEHPSISAINNKVSNKIKTKYKQSVENETQIPADCSSQKDSAYNLTLSSENNNVPRQNSRDERPIFSTANAYMKQSSQSSPFGRERKLTKSESYSINILNEELCIESNKCENRGSHKSCSLTSSRNSKAQKRKMTNKKQKRKELVSIYSAGDKELQHGSSQENLAELSCSHVGTDMCECVLPFLHDSDNRNGRSSTVSLEDRACLSEDSVENLSRVISSSSDEEVISLTRSEEVTCLPRNECKPKSDAASKRKSNEQVGESDVSDFFDEISEVDLPESETEPEPVELSPRELASLPELLSSTSSSSADKADDEFECECEMCRSNQLLFSARSNSWITEDEEEIIGAEAEEPLHIERNQAQAPLTVADFDPFQLTVSELNPFDLLISGQGHRDVLEVMFQNVILQMLAVYPELLNEQAPPPMDPVDLDRLPIVTIEESHLAEEATCPVCLCEFEAGEEGRILSCSHLFHQLCIEAWLVKSGTCPVCRLVLCTKPQGNG